jgi:hypothetical protein
MKGSRVVKKQPKNGPKKDLVLSEDRRIRRLMDNMSAAQTIIERKVTIVGVLATNGAGFIPATQVVSDTARSSPEFASFSSRYSQFRVKAIRVRLFPLVDATTAVTAGGGAVTPHPTALAFAKYMEGLGYINYASIVTGQSGKIFNGRERIIEYEVDWANVPEAKLWASSNAAIPVAQQYGIQYQDTGVAPASALATTYYRSLQEFVCQFTIPI